MVFFVAFYVYNSIYLWDRVDSQPGFEPGIRYLDTPLCRKRLVSTACPANNFARHRHVKLSLTPAVCSLNCRALSWQVHPPTAYCFAKHILFLLPYASVSMDVRHDILELARFLTELSVIDYYFVVHRPSLVALAALLNAMDTVPGVTSKARLELLQELGRVKGLDPSHAQVEECRNRLRLLYAQGGYSRPDEMSRSGENRTETVSPVCVTYGCEQASFERSSFSFTYPRQLDSKERATVSSENRSRPPSRPSAKEVNDVNFHYTEAKLGVA